MNFNINNTYKKVQLNNKADNNFLKGFLKENFLNKFEIISKYNSGQNFHIGNVNNEHFEKVSNDSWYDTSGLKKKKNIYLLCREIKNNNSEDIYKEKELYKNKIYSTKLNENNLSNNILKPINSITTNENDKKNSYALPSGSHSSCRHITSVSMREKKLYKLTKIRNSKKENIKSSNLKFNNYKITGSEELERSTCDINLNRLKSNFKGFKNKINKKKEVKNNSSKYKRVNSSRNYRDYDISIKNIKNILEEKDDSNFLKTKIPKMYDQNFLEKKDAHLINNLKKHKEKNIIKSDILKENNNEEIDEKIILTQIKKREYFSYSNASHILENKSKIRDNLELHEKHRILSENNDEKYLEHEINFINESVEKVSNNDEEELCNTYGPFNEETKRDDEKKKIYSLEAQSILSNRIYEEKKIITNEKKANSLSKKYILNKHRYQNKGVSKSLNNLLKRINEKEKKDLLLGSALTNFELSESKMMENLRRNNSKYIKSNFAISKNISDESDMKIPYLANQQMCYKTVINTEISFIIDFKIYKPMLMKKITQMCVYMDNKLLKNIYINEFPQSCTIVLQQKVKVNNEKTLAKIKNKIINIKETNVLKFVFLNNEKEIGYSYVSVKNLLCLGQEGGIFLLVEDYKKGINEEKNFMLSQTLPFNKQEINILRPKIFLNYKIFCPKFLVDSIPLNDIVTSRDKISYLEDMVREIYNFIQNSPLINCVKNGKLLYVINNKNFRNKNKENTKILDNSKNFKFLVDKLKCNEEKKKKTAKNHYDICENKNNMLCPGQQHRYKSKKDCIYYKKNDNNKCKKDKITCKNVLLKRNNRNTSCTVDYNVDEYNEDNSTSYANNIENNHVNNNESNVEYKQVTNNESNNENNSVNDDKSSSNEKNVLKKNINNKGEKSFNKSFSHFLGLDKVCNYSLNFNRNKIYCNIEDSEGENKDVKGNIKDITYLSEDSLAKSKINDEYHIIEEKNVNKVSMEDVIKCSLNLNSNSNSERYNLKDKKINIHNDVSNEEKINDSKKNSDAQNKLENKNYLNGSLKNEHIKIINNEKDLTKKTNYEEKGNIMNDEESEEKFNGMVSKKKIDNIRKEGEINEENKINQKGNSDMEKENDPNMHSEYSKNTNVEICNIDLNYKSNEVSHKKKNLELDKISFSYNKNNLKNMNNYIKIKDKEKYIKKNNSTKVSYVNQEIYNESKKRIEDLQNIIEENKRELELKKIEIEKLKHSNNNINILYRVCYRELLEIEKNKNIVEDDSSFKLNEMDRYKSRNVMASASCFKKNKDSTLHKCNSLIDTANTLKTLEKNKMKNNSIALSKISRKKSIVKYIEDDYNKIDMYTQKNEKRRLYLNSTDKKKMNIKFSDKENSHNMKRNSKEEVNLCDPQNEVKNYMNTKNHEDKEEELRILLKENEILKGEINKLKLYDEKYLNILSSLKEESLLNNKEDDKISISSSNKNVEKNYLNLYLDEVQKKDFHIDDEAKNRYIHNIRFNLPLDLINSYSYDLASYKNYLEN